MAAMTGPATSVSGPETFIIRYIIEIFGAEARQATQLTLEFGKLTVPSRSLPAPVQTFVVCGILVSKRAGKGGRLMSELQKGLNAELNWPRSKITAKLKAYGVLTKGKQSFLLLITGWAGFSSAKCPVIGWEIMLAMLGSLFLAICGSTVINMVVDRDIDGKMHRTAKRPLPMGILSVKEALTFGLLLSVTGVGWAFTLSSLYGWIVLSGLFIDVVIYSILLKRRTPFSIILGGVSGGMPILAGRALGLGSIDLVGILLALAVLLWIPIHIMTFNMKYAEDYRRAKIPTFPSVYGESKTRLVLAGSAILASIDIVLAAKLIGITGNYYIFLVLLGLALMGLAVFSVIRPSPALNFKLFKAASLYMLSSMGLIALAV